MPRRDQQLVIFAIIAAIVCAAYWALWIVTADNSALLLTLFMHVTAAGLTARLVPSDRRPIAIALGLVVPVLGPVAAALAAVIVGRGGTELLHDPHAISARFDGSEIARRLVSDLPVCEALFSADLEARRQALTKLKARANAEDISVLRWARSQTSGDAAIEIALAFEEISSVFEQRVAAARSAAVAAPSYKSLSSLFQILAGGVTSGVVDASIMTRVASEGCRYHAAAVELDPIRGSELLVGRARLALAMHRPSEALTLLSESNVELDACAELGEIYREAVYAARRFNRGSEASRACA